MTTVATAEEAGVISTKIVAEGLAACSNIVPGLRSIYLWKGKMRDEAEQLCIFKSRAELFEDLKARIIELHSYETPEVVAIEISDGSKDYLDWIEDSTVKGTK